MKFLLSGLFISLAVSLSAAKPACYWDFDNINPKTRAPLSNNGIHYYNALIIENGGVNGTNGLLCNGKRRNQIVLPLMKPALAVQLIFTFVSSWNNYFIPSLLINKASKKTLPLLIAQLRSADFLKFDMGQVYMMIAFAIVPVIIVYICLSKFIVRGVTLGGVKG